MNHSVQSMAKLTGVTPARLRTWERRYGIPGPGRTAAGHRRYTPADVDVVRRMMALVQSGVPAGEAARALRAGSKDPEPGAIAAENLGQRATGLIAAVSGLDGASVSACIRDAVGALGWADALGTVIFPALGVAGDRWHAGLLTPAHEHLLSNAIRQELLLGIARYPAPPLASPLALLACPGTEDHDLGLLSLRLFLERSGVRVLYLGASLPAPALARAASETGPDAVCLSATSAAGAAALAEAERAVFAVRPRPLLFLGGPATRTYLPSGPAVVLPPDFQDAAAIVAHALEVST